MVPAIIPIVLIVFSLYLLLLCLPPASSIAEIQYFQIDYQIDYYEIVLLFYQLFYQ